MRNNFFIAIFIFLISLTQFSCVSNNKSKRIIVASSGKIESLDPARASTLKSIQLLSSLGDTLYELNSEGELIPPGNSIHIKYLQEHLIVEVI